MRCPRLPATKKPQAVNPPSCNSAFNTAGVIISVGNSFSPVAPASSASNASLAVIKPGRQTIKRAALMLQLA